MYVVLNVRGKQEMKGIYVLIIKLHANIRISIGALGELAFPAGLYAYVGSAQNSLEKRATRHLRKEKRLFWHIDYLLNSEAARVIDVLCKEGVKTEECHIASLLEANAKPIYGFGCSDCRCRSHLFFAQNFGFLRNHMQPLELS